MAYKRVAQLKNRAAFEAHLQSLGVEIGCDDAIEPEILGAPYQGEAFMAGNRFCILPMEGWDGTPDGKPSELTERRWQRFGQSGAKLIWGGEAVAVRHDGRANPNQLMLTSENLSSIEQLRQKLVDAHAAHFGTTNDLFIGLQLTHSGRFARPNKKDTLEPTIAYHHPLLDPKFKVPPDYPVMSDTEIEHLIEQFVQAAKMAQEIGFHFVDIKHCHGYLGHEFLSAKDRPGKYGGSFENRTRFLREITAGIRRDAPGLQIGVRLSAFDLLPYQPGADGTGVPTPYDPPYIYAFGVDPMHPAYRYDLSETHRFLQLLEELEIPLVCISAGSPYYNPHIQRPALFPPSDGYLPPEDPLVGVARQLSVVAQLKAEHPKLAFVGSGYSYLQEFVALVGQNQVRNKHVDFVGLGRMVLAYPDLPADMLAGRPLQRKQLCRTFSDCTTAPRNGFVSGCYPLDHFYKQSEVAEKLEALKYPTEAK